MRNRSVPTNVVVPHVFYRSVVDAIRWLTETFGFVEHFRYGDPANPEGAQMYFGEAVIMLGRLRPDRAAPVLVGHCTQMLTLFVEEIDGHYDRARAGRAKIIEELQETVYGERQYGVEDLDGHRWIFSRHAKDLSPEEWGANVATPFTGR